MRVKGIDVRVTASQLRIAVCDLHRKDYGRSLNQMLNGLQQASPADADRLRLALNQAIVTTVNEFAQQLEAEHEQQKGGA
jgi:hypothetical protein